jgi:hypothetical protein
MYNAPPPPQTRKPTPWALIILILGAGFLAAVGICAGAGYMAFESVKKAPEARKGFGKPALVKYLDEGWARYRFAEVPLTIDLPGAPEADKLEFELGSNLFTESWIYYGLQSEVNSFEIVGNWYHDENDADLEDEAAYSSEWARLSMEASQVKSDVRDATYGRFTGKEAEGTCIVDGDPMAFRFFYFKEGKAVFAVHSYAWKDHADDGSKEYERVLKSIQLK